MSLNDTHPVARTESTPPAADWPAEAPTPSAELEEQARDTRSARRDRKPWYVAAGAGAAGLVVGGVLGATLSSAGASGTTQGGPGGGAPPGMSQQNGQTGPQGQQNGQTGQQGQSAPQGTTS